MVSVLPSSFPSARQLDQSTAPSLRWGIIGPGHIAAEFVPAVQRFTSQQVAAVASRSLERSTAFAKRFGLPLAFGSVDELLARTDIDAVYVAVPTAQHLPIGLQAIAAGKHVLIEKPLANSAADGKLLTEAAQAAGVMLMEALWSRYLPQFDVIRQLVADGVLGEVQLVLADHGRALVSREDVVDPSASVIAGMGIYPIALASELLGAPSAILAQGLASPNGVDLTATVALKHPSGALAALNTSIITRTPIIASIAGSQARIDIAEHFFTPTGFTLATREKLSQRLEWTDPTGMAFYDGLSWEATALATYAAEGRFESPLHDHQETLSILATIDEARSQVVADGAS